MQTSDPSLFFRSEADIALSNARERKAERTKQLGNPIKLPTAALFLQVLGNDVWIAESGSVARKASLKTGKTQKVFKGHSGPVTSLQLYKHEERLLLFTGSWDKTIKTWDATNGELLSSVNAHRDFVKVLLVIPRHNVLISGSSDKSACIWDISGLGSESGFSPRVLGSLSNHTRPVSCLAYNEVLDEVYTGDTMGVINTWSLDFGADRANCRGTLITQIEGHRTGANHLVVSDSHLWTASTDKTLLLHSRDPQKPIVQNKPIEHPEPVNFVVPLANLGGETPYLVTAAGEGIYTYDIEEFRSGEGEASLLGVIDAHAHNVTALGVWFKESDDIQKAGTTEILLISGSLDGTVRQWKLSELLSPPKIPLENDYGEGRGLVTLTEEEEKELDDLLNSD